MEVEGERGEVHGCGGPRELGVLLPPPRELVRTASSVGHQIGNRIWAGKTKSDGWRWRHGRGAPKGGRGSVEKGGGSQTR